MCVDALAWSSEISKGLSVKGLCGLLYRLTLQSDWTAKISQVAQLWYMTVTRSFAGTEGLYGDTSGITNLQQGYVDADCIESQHEDVVCRHATEVSCGGRCNNRCCNTHIGRVIEHFYFLSRR